MYDRLLEFLNKHKILNKFQFGIIFDNKLKWNEHINYISKTIAKGIGVIIKAWNFFDEATLLSIYISLILPYICYCIHIWGNTYQIHPPKTASFTE